MSNPSPTQHIPEWTVGERLWKARRDAKISTAKMAEDLGIDRKTVNNYEAMRTPVTRATLLAWSMLTRVPVEWLQWGATSPTPPRSSGCSPTNRQVTGAHLRIAA